MTHEEYVLSCRRRAVELAKGILTGHVHVLEGCHELASLRWEVEVDEWDEDFVTFSAISSETDSLPVGQVRAHWSSEALERLEPQMQSAVAWAIVQITPACQSVVQRFGA
jgi:hypothetical protein